MLVKPVFYWFLVCFGVGRRPISSTVIYSHLQWDPRNSFFQENNSMNVEPMSRINIVCPNPALVPAKIQNTIPKEQLYENLWIVDKDSYDACAVDTSKSTNRLVMQCNDPLKLSYYTIVFQQFSATPNGLEFQPGKEYYFIATSDGTQTSLAKTSGGHCASLNMKMTIYVCVDLNDLKCQDVLVPTTVTCSTQAPTTPAPTTPGLSSCADSSNILSIYNDTNLLPSMSNQVSLIPEILSTLQNLSSKLNIMENKLHNCTSGTPGIPATPVTTTTPATPVSPIPSRNSCVAHYNAGLTTSGVYPINPDNLGEFNVLCDQTTDGGGWAVFQKRFDGSVNFSREWTKYSDGFGSLNGEFWLGLNKINRLASTPVQLRVDLVAKDGEERFALYSGFSVADSAHKYTLTSGTYIGGTAGDSLGFSNGANFSTIDQDNDQWLDKSCAVYFKSAWWHNVCHKASLNGMYRDGSHPLNFADGIIWETWKGYTYSYTKTDMKVKS